MLQKLYCLDFWNFDSNGSVKLGKNHEKNTKSSIFRKNG